MPISLSQVIDQGQVWQARTQQNERPSLTVLDSGFAVVNEHLPGGGWAAGQVCEIYAQPGQGELSLILPALATLSEQPRWILWVAGPQFQQQLLLPQPAALLAAGIDIRRILLVHPKDEEQALWCMEEGLKSGHCSAVLGWPAHLNKPHIRRLQLAASQHQSYCWLWPQCAFDSSGSPAAIRLSVQRLNAQQLQAVFHKRRGSWPSQPFVIPTASAKQ